MTLNVRHTECRDALQMHAHSGVWMRRAYPYPYPYLESNSANALALEYIIIWIFSYKAIQPRDRLEIQQIKDIPQIDEERLLVHSKKAIQNTIWTYHCG